MACRYQIDVNSTNAEIHFELYDQMGTVMEGVNGVVPVRGPKGTAKMSDSLEWANPRLKVSCKHSAIIMWYCIEMVFEVAEARVSCIPLSEHLGAARRQAPHP